MFTIHLPRRQRPLPYHRTKVKGQRRKGRGERVKAKAQSPLLFVTFLFSIIISPPLNAGDSLATSFRRELDTRTFILTGSFEQSYPTLSLQGYAYNRLVLRQLPGFESQWKRDTGIYLESNRVITPELSFLIEVDGNDFQDREAARIIEGNLSSPLPTDLTSLPLPARQVTGQNSHIGRSVARSGVQWSPGTMKDKWQGAKGEGIERAESQPGTAPQPGTADATLYLLAGGAWDRQLAGEGSGPSMKGGFSWKQTGENLISLNGEGWINLLQERRFHDASLTSRMQRQFGEAVDHLEAAWINRRNDLYFGEDNHVVQRLQDEWSVQNRLSAPLGTDLAGIYDLTIRNSGIAYRDGGPGKSREDDIIHLLQGKYNPASWFAKLSFRYAYEDRDYGGSLILGRHASLELELGKPILKDSLKVRLGTEKNRYDSPDSLELSDRDRLVHHAVITSGFWVTPTTHLNLELSLLLDHLVYIHRLRSADNRWNRVLIFRPTVDWEPARGWWNRAVCEVLANYNIYDFETQAASGSFRSLAFRRWSAADTLHIPLTYNLKSILCGRLDLEDHGRMLWKEFTEDLSDEAQISYASIHLVYSYLMLANVELGYRYQRRFDDRFEKDLEGKKRRIRSRTYLKYGPALRISTIPPSPVNFALEGEFQLIEDSQRPAPYRLDTVYAILSYRW